MIEIGITLLSLVVFSVVQDIALGFQSWRLEVGKVYQVMSSMSLSVKNCSLVYRNRKQPYFVLNISPPQMVFLPLSLGCLRHSDGDFPGSELYIFISHSDPQFLYPGNNFPFVHLYSSNICRPLSYSSFLSFRQPANT